MILAQARTMGLDFQEYVRFYLAILAKKNHPLLDFIERYDPAFTDTLAIMSNKQIQEALEEDEKHIKRGEVKPFNESLLGE